MVRIVDDTALRSEGEPQHFGQAEIRPLGVRRLDNSHVHLVAAIPHGLTIEYMPWTLRLFEEPPALVDGQLVAEAEIASSLVERSLVERSSEINHAAFKPVEQ